MLMQQSRNPPYADDMACSLVSPQKHWFWWKCCFTPGFKFFLKRCDIESGSHSSLFLPETKHFLHDSWLSWQILTCVTYVLIDFLFIYCVLHQVVMKFHHTINIISIRFYFLHCHMNVNISKRPNMSRPSPSDQHAPGHLCPTETARHYPLPSGRQPTCDISEVGERRLRSQSGEGQSLFS